MLCECVMMTLSVIANVIFAWSEHVCACSLRYCMMWRKRFQSGTAGCDITGFHFLSHGHTTAVLAELAALFYHSTSLWFTVHLGASQYITVLHSTSPCFTIHFCASQNITVLQTYISAGMSTSVLVSTAWLSSGCCNVRARASDRASNYSASVDLICGLQRILNSFQTRLVACRVPLDY